MDNEVSARWRAFFPTFFEPSRDVDVSEFYPTDTTPDGLRKWIADATTTFEVSTTELAREADLAPSTLNRFVRNTGGRDSLSANTIQAISTAMRGMALLKKLRSGAYTLRTVDAEVIGKIGASGGTFELPNKERHTLRVPPPLALFRSRLLGVRHLEFLGGNPKEATAERTKDSIYIGTPGRALDRPQDGTRFIVHRAEADSVVTEIRTVVIDPSGRAWLMAPEESQQRALFLPDLGAAGMTESTFVSLLVVYELKAELWANTLFPMHAHFGA